MVDVIIENDVYIPSEKYVFVNMSYQEFELWLRSQLQELKFRNPP